MSGKNQKGIDETLSRFAQKDADDETNQPVRLTEDADTGDRVLIFSSEKGVEIQLRYEGESLWISQSQMAELFGRDISSISRHITNILDEEELDESTSLQKVQTTTGRPAKLYNLDMIISVGYRVSSKQGTLFRKWATSKLVQFATKGFVVDVERLKNPKGTDHFRELKELIQEIRASEANVYKEVTRICSLCSDYHSKSGKDKGMFFSIVQNKLHYAVTGMTGAEVRLERANANQDSMGLTNWAGDRPTQRDTLTAKNFLGEAEIRDLNRFTGMLLDYFEQELDLGRLVTMQDAETKVDTFIKNNERAILQNAGRISKAVADKHAKAQYEIYKNQQRKIAHDAAMEGD
ncbi:MAG: RhuM family protein [Rhizobiaceae bacterium]